MEVGTKIHEEQSELVRGNTSEPVDGEGWEVGF